MQKRLIEEIEAGIDKRINTITPVSGGCCCSNFCVVTNDRGYYFCKTAPNVSGLFNAEAVGLTELKKSNFVIPRVLYQSETVLVLEYLRQATPRPDYYKNAGRMLAYMHRIFSDSFGFHTNNFIGLTPQINTQTTSWPEFFWTNRIEYQIHLLEDRNLLSQEMKSLFFKLSKKFEQLLTTEEESITPVLLHGDLWSGNIMPVANGNISVFDPAVYYGHNETDLAMTELFGGFPQEFYQAYFSENKMEKGFQRRQPIYKLYHILNHINLFGKSYSEEATLLLRQSLQNT